MNDQDSKVYPRDLLRPFNRYEIDGMKKVLLETFRHTANSVTIHFYPFTAHPKERDQLWTTLIRAQHYGGSQPGERQFALVSMLEPIERSLRLAVETQRPVLFDLTFIVHQHIGSQCLQDGLCQGVTFDGNGSYMAPPGQPEAMAYASTPSAPSPPIVGNSPAKDREIEKEMTEWSPSPVTLTPNEYDVLRGKAKQYDRLRRIIDCEV